MSTANAATVSQPAVSNDQAGRSNNRLLHGAVPVTLDAAWPKIKFVVKDLGIAAGAVVLLVGYGFSGKSLFAMQLALSITTGRMFLDRYPVVKGKVLHVDFEQGRDESMVRYRRLGNGLGLSERKLDGLAYVEHPKFTLDDEDAEELLSEASSGYTLCIIDSFRAVVAGDENDSKVRIPLDRLGRVSARTGCTFLVIHHSGKREPDDARQSPRGSSAIFDSAGTVLELRAKGDDTVHVKQTKTRNVKFGGVTFRIHASGSMVEEIGRSEALALVVADEEAAARKPPVSIEEFIVRALHAAPGMKLHTDALKQAVGKRAQDYSAALNGLLKSNAVRRNDEKDGKAKKAYYQLDESVARWAVPAAFRDEGAAEAAMPSSVEGAGAQGTEAPRGG